MFDDTQEVAPQESGMKLSTGAILFVPVGVIQVQCQASL